MLIGPVCLISRSRFEEPIRPCSFPFPSHLPLFRKKLAQRAICLSCKRFVAEHGLDWRNIRYY